MSGIYIIEADTMPAFVRVGFTNQLSNIGAHYSKHYGPNIKVRMFRSATAAILKKIAIYKYGDSSLYPISSLNAILGELGSDITQEASISGISRMSSRRLLLGDILELRTDITNNIGFKICDEYMQNWMIISNGLSPGTLESKVLVIWLDERTYKIEIGEDVLITKNGEKVTSDEIVMRRERLIYAFSGDCHSPTGDCQTPTGEQPISALMNHNPLPMYPYIEHEKFSVLFGGDMALRIILADSDDTFYVTKAGRMFYRSEGVVWCRHVGKWINVNI